MRVRAMIRDIRFKFGVWIGNVWVPELSDFAFKVLADEKEFNQIITRVQTKIDRLETVKTDLQECRDSPDYKNRVKEFFELKEL